MIVRKIDDWVQGKDKLPSYREMWGYICASNRVAPVTRLVDFDGRYRAIRERGNDHMHQNFFKFIYLNDARLYIEDRQQHVAQVLEDARDLVTLHTAYLFYLKPYYMSSSDYLDHLECGMTPPEGSQHFVAPFVQTFFNDVIRAHRPDIADLIKGGSAMMLD